MAQQGNFFASLLPIIVFFGIFYFLIIRPQQKQAKEHKKMIQSLKKGDRIITTGGLIVEVLKPEEDFIKVKLNDEVVAKLSKEYVAKKLES